MHQIPSTKVLYQNTRTVASNFSRVSFSSKTKELFRRDPAPQGQIVGPNSIGATSEPAQSIISPIPDDTATIYSPASSIDMENYVPDLARDLFGKVQFKDFDRQNMDRVLESLPDLLQAFALKIGHNTDNPIYRDVMYLVHKHRREIVTHLRSLNSSKEDIIPDTQASYIDRSGYTNDWVQTSVAPYGAEEMDSDLSGPVSTIREEEDDAPKLPPEYQDLIYKAPAYEWLISSLLREPLLVQPKPNQMDAVKKKIMKSLPSSHRVSKYRPAEAYVTTFEVIWDPVAFVKEQKYEGEPDEAIEIALTLTGTAKDAQAFPCGQYLKQIWGTSGEHIIRLVKDVVRSENSRCTRVLPDRTKLTAWMDESKFMLEAYGTGQSVAEIGQQLAWLGAALRSSPYEVGVGFCTPFVLCQSQPDPQRNFVYIARCKINFQVEKPLIQDKSGNGQCWQDMFRNPLVVKGYPILRRAGPELGLEIPLNAITALAQTKWVDTFNGKLFIKGFSTMLVPTKRTGDLLVWHHLFHNDGSRMSYLDANIPHLENVSTSTLEQVRHVVGWHSKVKSYAGAADATYNMMPSGLPGPHAGCALEKVSISGGKFVAAGVSVGIGVRDKPIHVSRNGYVDKLQWIHKKYVVFWDEEVKRGWLVNGTSALLHLLRTSLRLNTVDDFSFALLCKPEDLKEASTPHTTRSAIRVLMDEENKDLPLYVDKVETYEEETTKIDGNSLPGIPEKVIKKKTTYVRVVDRIERLYNVIEKIIDHQIEIEGQSGVNMKIRVRRHLEGWDFRDLAADNDPYKPHVVALQTIGSGWVDFTRAIRAITLFGRGFGEIIQPSNTIFCSRWRALPEHGYYLAVCVSDLKEIMLQHEGDVTAIPRKLTRDITWHSPDTAFEPCKCRGQTLREHSEFAQVPIPSRLNQKLSSKQSNTTLDDGGAVVFGHNKNFNFFFPDQGDPVEGPPQHIRIETGSQFHDSGIGSNQSSSTVVESEPSTSIAHQLSNDSPAGRMSPQTAPPSAAVTTLAIQSSQGSSIAAVNEDSETSSASQLALGNPHHTLTRRKRKRVYDNILPWNRNSEGPSSRQ
ncbi:hypothetical protein V494_06530 [Pseudogymnoascus sp. VKM F-4513 (FW-928)]|nr:hypothetical protein V490_08225 [Pseudogymnoascus sp. VKM F-3557]KFY34721.1 hypothetical protein V494_06530 [Pseudogymnoascus sp. VKM F-4513 (FW-928)]